MTRRTVAHGGHFFALLLAIFLGWGLAADVAACSANPGGPPGGGTCSAASSAASPGSPNPGTGAGNPVNVITGNKYQREDDLPAMSGDLGIELVRHYNSTQRGVLGLAGAGWKFSYETRLHVFSDTLQIAAADGSRYIFNRDPRNPSLCASDDPGAGRLRVIRRPSGAEEFVWTWTGGPDPGRRLRFDANGLLESIESPQGGLVTLLYGTDGELLKVRDPLGRSLQFNYAPRRAPGFKGVVSVDTPIGRFEYLHDDDPKSAGISNLVAVRYPASAGQPAMERRYHYGMDAGEKERGGGAAHALTGIGVLVAGTDAAAAREERISTYAYDSQGRAVLTVRGRPRERDAKGEIVPGTGIDQEELSYASADPAADGRQPSFRTVLTNAVGRKTSYLAGIVAGEWRLLEARGPGCTTCPETNMRYRYDSAGRLVESSELDEEGRPRLTDYFDRDRQGRIIRVRQQAFEDAGPSNGMRVKVRYAYEGDRVEPSEIATPSVVPGREHRLRIEYGPNDRPVRIRESGFTPLDARGLDAVTPIERESEIRYDERGRVIEVSGPLAGRAERTKWTYDGLGRIERIEQPGGLATGYEYDALSRMTGLTGPGGVRAVLGYDELGRPSRLEIAGAELRLRYDPRGRAFEMLRNTGERLRFERDAADRIVGVIDPASGTRISLTRDAEGRLTGRRLINPDGSLAQVDATVGGEPSDDDSPRRGARLEGFVDDNRGIWGLAFDAQGLPQALFDPAGGAVRLVRDAQSRVTKVVDARSVATGYSYDDFNRLVRVVSPDSGVNRYFYDDHDRLLRRLTARGDELRYHYDEAGRLTGVDTPEGRTTVEYNAIGKPGRIVYPEGEERFEFDEAGRLASHSRSVDGKSAVTSYAYNAAGQIAAMTLPDGSELAYEYRGGMHAKAGLLAAIRRKGLLRDETIVDGLNEAGEFYADTGWRFGNGLTYRRTLDLQGRLIREGTQGVSPATDGLSPAQVDPAGRIAEYVPTSAQLAKEGLAYDLAGNIVQRTFWHSRAGLPASFFTRIGLAPGSNRIERLEQGDSTGPAGERIEYAYDAAGQPVRIGRRELVWDSQGRLVEVRDPGSDGVVRPVARYSYNAFGERIRKVVYSANGGSRPGKVTYFFHDGSRLTAELGEEGWSAYAWMGDRAVAVLRGKALFFLHTDGRGAPQAVTDQDRSIVWRASTEAYGAAQVESLPGSNFSLNLRASNQYADAETGWHYNLARYFDPVTGRYLSPDPIGQKGGVNVYAFAAGNPLANVDPLGTQAAPVSPVANPAVNVSGWTFQQKLSYMLQESISLNVLGPEIVSVLRSMVSPASLAVTAGVFTAWALAQLTPFGWIADAAVAGIGYFFLGETIVQMIQLVVQTYNQVSSAQCSKDLDAASKTFANLLAQIAVNLGLYGATKLADLMKPFFKTAASGVWNLTPFARGVAIEKALGHNVPPSYPVIDIWNPATGLGTSIKSVDLAAPTYQSASSLTSLIKGYINTLAQFKGVNRPSLNTFGKITSRQLDVVIPSSGTPAQWQALNALKQYAASQGVTLNIVIMP